MTYDINAINATGMDTLFSGISGQLDFLFPMILAFIYAVIFIAGAFANKRLSGDAEPLRWNLVASFVTFVSAALLALTPGIINRSIVVICGVLVVFNLIAAVAFKMYDKMNQ